MRENIAFKWISGCEEVDFRTLNNFRLRLGEEMKSVFRQVLEVALKNKIIKAKDIFIDHSKFEANASRFRMIWKKKVSKQMSKIDEELDHLFSYVKHIESSENKKYGKNDYPEIVKKHYSDDEIEAGLFYTAYNLEKMYRHAMKALGEDKRIPPFDR